jgi:tetratricopeptide (TPR) repeat protein
MASYSNRGSEFDYLMQFDNAIRDFNISLKFAYELNDIYQEIKNFSNIGVTYWHMRKPEKALLYLNYAIIKSDETDETDDAYNVNNTLKTIAEIYSYQKQYLKANEILLTVLKRNEDIDNIRQSAAILTSLGRNLMELNEMDKALGYLLKSLEITIKINAPYEMIENYRNLAHAQAILHNFNAADSLQDLYAETYTRLFNNDSIAGINKKKDTVSVERIISSTSNTSNWVIAFALIALTMILSLIAFREKRKDE